MGLNGSITNPSSTGATDGSIKVWSSTGISCQYSLNGGPYQSDDQFRNLAAGHYTISARTQQSCTATVDFTLVDPVASCAGVSITINATTTDQIPCETPGGSITVHASGGSAPYQYSVDGGAFQNAALFTGLNSGSHSLLVKDAHGCTGGGTTTIGNAPAGPSFSAVRTLIQHNCSYCHSGVGPGPVNYSIDCNIIANKLAIKARVVDGNPSYMPSSGPLSASEKQKILDWLAAGGRYSD